MEEIVLVESNEIDGQNRETKELTISDLKTYSLNQREEFKCGFIYDGESFQVEKETYLRFLKNIDSVTIIKRDKKNNSGYTQISLIINHINPDEVKKRNEF